MVRWWEWRIVQGYYLRQYLRADRRAFRRECAEIRWRAVWRGDVPAICLASPGQVAATLAAAGLPLVRDLMADRGE